ncbi:hypothetical protein BB14905_13955 [Bacillus sp. B14905]|nr:hypothetical protein BB14905_13955 [Bacillus sp. B14905]
MDKLKLFPVFFVKKNGGEEDE